MDLQSTSAAYEAVYCASRCEQTPKSPVKHQLAPRATPQLVLLTVLLIANLTGAAEARQCYRCMSHYYGQVWDFMGYHRIYQQPAQFTDFCAYPQKSRRPIEKETCQQFSNCVTIREKLEVGMGNVGYIRGCYDSIFRWGFNRTGDSGRLQYKEFCREFNSTDLINNERPKPSRMYVCSCRSDECNGDANGSTRHRLRVPMTTTAGVVVTAVLGLAIHGRSGGWW